MNHVLDNLLLNLYRAAQEHHKAGALYYDSKVKGLKNAQQKAAQRYRSTAEIYLVNIINCEQYLLSIHRDKDLEDELKRIQSLKRSVNIVISHL